MNTAWTRFEKTAIGLRLNKPPLLINIKGGGRINNKTKKYGKPDCRGLRQFKPPKPTGQNFD
jgi:hypothetical protein